MSELRDLQVPGWMYRVASWGTVITLAGERDDTRASLPLVVASATSFDEAILKLRRKAIEWDDGR